MAVESTRSVATDPREWLPSLVVGDLLVVAGLLVVGSMTHGENPLTMPVEVGLNVLPFVVGWLVAAGLLGTFAAGTVADLLTAGRYAAGTWLGATTVGLLLREGVVGETAAWPFPLVITGLGVVALSAWRVAVALRVR